MLDMKAIAREVARIIDRGEVEFQHDDDAHRGSAKRNQGAGVAALTPAGYVLIQEATPPAAANGSGIAGSIAYDADYIYVCVATDTWKRAAIVTWP